MKERITIRSDMCLFKWYLIITFFDFRLGLCRKSDVIQDETKFMQDRPKLLHRYPLVHISAS